jgi:hypothetical protein
MVYRTLVAAACLSLIGGAAFAQKDTYGGGAVRGGGDFHHIIAQTSNDRQDSDLVLRVVDNAALDAGVLQELMNADGSVVVLLTSNVDPAALGAVLSALASATTTNVRFGISDSLSNFREVTDQIEAVSQSNEEWQVCAGWLMTERTATGTGSAVIAEISGRFSGSLIVMDNGSDDSDRYHPAIGEDSVIGLGENPAIFGATNPSLGMGLVTDQNDYRAAWETAVYGMSQGSDPAGC